MSKNKIVFLTALFVLIFSGCISSLGGVKVGLPNSISLNRSTMLSFNVSYESTYSGAQNVTINLNTNDRRLGLSTSKLGPFTQVLLLKKEVSNGYTNSMLIYVKVTDSFIPDGNYKVSGTIQGEKTGTALGEAEMTVSISP